MHTSPAYIFSFADEEERPQCSVSHVIECPECLCQQPDGALIAVPLPRPTVAHRHTHVPLEQPGSAQIRLVGHQGSQVTLAECVSPEGFIEPVGDSRQMPDQRREAAERQRGLLAAGVTHCYNAVKARLERAVLVGLEEAKHHTEKLQVIQFHALVFGQQCPVVLEQRLERRTRRIRIAIRKHVCGSVCRPRPGREGLPEILHTGGALPTPIQGCVRVDEIAPDILVLGVAARTRTDNEADAIRLLAFPELP
mmetsp:Transcript_1349/g.3526  ORF Transcript_1349/g.3526 Transcript_1349/m.3526 type:complete len:252 (-) Transcript_1349:957-1712(-)